MATSTEYVEIENNMGAVIFFAYIAAALFFTVFIVRDLLALQEQSSRARQKTVQPQPGSHSPRPIALFVLLSLISFSVLSYHMLNFLITSYTTWARLNGVSLSPSTFELARTIWQWSKASTLFQDFAEVIVDDPVRFWWTQQALLYSMAWSMHMAAEGKRHQIPHLWAYFVLAQILPISFTQNLFCLALLYTKDLDPGRNVGFAPSLSRLPWVLMFYAGVFFAPNMIRSAYFIPAILGIRMHMFQLYYAESGFGFNTSGIARAPNNARFFWAVILTASVALHMWQTYKIWPLRSVDLLHALHSSPAVSALAYDYLIGLASIVIWVVLRPLATTKTSKQS